MPILDGEGGGEFEMNDDDIQWLCTFHTFLLNSTLRVGQVELILLPKGIGHHGEGTLRLLERTWSKSRFGVQNCLSTNNTSIFSHFRLQQTLSAPFLLQSWGLKERKTAICCHRLTSLILLQRHRLLLTRVTPESRPRKSA